MGLFNLFKKNNSKQQFNQLAMNKKVDVQKIKKYINVPKSIEARMLEIDSIVLNNEKDAETKTNELLNIYESLTDDQKKTRAGRYIIAHIAEVYFAASMIDEAFENFNFVMQFKDTIGNPFLHLRLGQLNYLTKNTDKMNDELSRALIMGGESIFKDEDPKLIKMVKSVLEEPADCSWAEYEGQDFTATQ
ncbi:hypothetical protein [Maribacter sp. 1_2014MBL_MicDiv]|uniref:hypothetical protein n=1 Tax=Maribacter sp. 1_2014MBL_MicDiv TaxID=1644130 RepID=UPI0008F4A43A|nr:hypothetical protein [Maribacter sp. 1_2014MBL_MicDiv]